MTFAFYFFSMLQIEFILYVADQTRSRDFYAQLLDKQPTLAVMGMTEFELGDTCKLGLMPENGIAKIITPALPHPATGSGIPRCELYLVLEDILPLWQRGLKAGAKIISEIAPRDWGHRVGYLADPDGHLVALAKR
jgi:lactoylglutathione lyase